METPKVVVTMTSWKKRIGFVSRCIYHFFTRQTVKPDLFYLWLSEAEFPGKENDLPEELLLIIEGFNVKLRWVKGNEFCFKRWHVYPEHYNDLVISIDDDIFFDPMLIECAKSHIAEKNIIYGIFKDLMYKLAFKPNNTRDYKIDKIPSLRHRLLGCSVYCPESFPLDSLSAENLQIRSQICKRCDETWLKPFTLMNDTKIGYLNFSYKSVMKNDKFQDSSSTWSHLIKRYDGFMVRDYQLWINLQRYPKHLEKFMKVFPEYNKSFYLKKGLAFCYKVLKDNDA